VVPLLQKPIMKIGGFEIVILRIFLFHLRFSHHLKGSRITETVMVNATLLKYLISRLWLLNWRTACPTDAPAKTVIRKENGLLTSLFFESFKRLVLPPKL